MKVLALVLASWAASAAAQAQPSVAFKTDINAAKAATGGAVPAAPAQGEVNTAAANIGVNEKIIDSGVQDIAWVGEDHSGVVLVLSVGGILHRTADGGKTWSNQMPRIKSLLWELRGQNEVATSVTSIIPSKADPLFVFFTGNNGLHFLTRDGGATYQPVSSEEQLGEIRLHPTDTNMILAAGLSEKCGNKGAAGACFKRLFVSLDGGKSFEHRHDYVVQFDWAHAMRSDMVGDYPPQTILYSSMADRKGRQRFGKWDHRVNLYITEDLFVNSRMVIERGNRFLFTDLYLAVAQVDDKGQHVSLALSTDGGRHIRPVGMPYEIRQHSYTILDTSEGTVFLHVNHGGERAMWGNVYTSNAIGTNFSLSLPFNRRDENGKCDFEKLQSLEGVYVANYYDNAEALEDAGQHRIGSSPMGQEDTGRRGGARPSKGAAAIEPVVRTVITFDKGAIWEYLNPPKLRANGSPLRCPKGKKHCSLHLHGVTDVFGPFYATESAVGMMMATGCVGDRLCFREGSINTYLSRDGGHEWYEVATGSHIYEFGDHGGLVVMAFDERPVTTLRYSWNEGLTWESYDFTTTPVLIDNIMIEPGSTSTRFLVYGTRESSSGGRAGVVFHVDFGELHTRVCKGVEIPDADESDYETWTPSAGDNQDGCLLGHRVQYTRRKREAECFNGEELERSQELEHCTCEERDFECDVGYRRATGGGPCERDPMVPAAAAIPVPCPAGATYVVTDGHRKVSGDTCVGGVAHPGVTQLCPSSSWHHHLAPSRWFVLLLCLSLAFGLCFAQYNLAAGRSRPKGCLPATFGCLRFAAATTAAAAGWAVEGMRALAGSAGSRGFAGRPADGKQDFSSAFGGSLGAGPGDASSAAYKPMTAGDSSADPLPWDDEGGLMGGEDGEDFQFDDAAEGDALDAAFAELGAGGGDDDLLGTGAATPSRGQAHVPKLGAPRTAKED